MERVGSMRFALPPLVAFIVLVACGPQSPRVPSTAASSAAQSEDLVPHHAAEAWLQRVDRGAYDESWREASTLLRDRIEPSRFAAALAGARSPLGRVTRRSLRTETRSRTAEGLPDGDYVSIVYDATFERAGAQIETIGLASDRDGRWRVISYFVRAAATACAPAAPLTTTLANPPATLGLDTFYKKYVDAEGLPIVSSERTTDRALFAARDIARHMLRKRPDVRERLARARVRIVVMASSEVTLDVPEHAELAGTPTDVATLDWNERARGLGATMAIPVTSAGEENLTCLPCDRYRGENVLMHELGHSIMNLGLAGDTVFQRALHAAYDDAISRGLWRGTYAAKNVDEYWAEGVQDWFDANLHDVADHNDVHTRAQLAGYDAALHRLLASVFEDDGWRYSCSARIDETASPPLVVPANALEAKGCPSEMAPLPGGTFLMGYATTVTSFCLDRKEATVAEYGACVRSGACAPAPVTASWDGISDAQRATWSAWCNGARADRADHPINCIAWSAADAYCRAKGKRLPTDAEWEWAARGGPKGLVYPWGYEAPGARACWSQPAKREGTCPVASFPGGDGIGEIHDLAGNVWEWTSSAIGNGRVQKGGGWNDTRPANLRVARSLEGDASFRGPNVGFRCAR
jgi:formylglycine-generating enzyme required for sulfatase activity